MARSFSLSALAKWLMLTHTHKHTYTHARTHACTQVMLEYLEEHPSMDPRQAMDVKAQLLDMPVESEATRVRVCAHVLTHMPIQVCVRVQASIGCEGVSL